MKTTNLCEIVFPENSLPKIPLNNNLWVSYQQYHDYKSKHAFQYWILPFVLSLSSYVLFSLFLVNSPSPQYNSTNKEHERTWKNKDRIQYGKNTSGGGASGGDSELENIKFIFSAEPRRRRDCYINLNALLCQKTFAYDWLKPVT